MSRVSKQRSLSRRRFLQQSVTTVGLLGVAAATNKWGKAATPKAASETNPYAYDVSRLAKTDPKLVHYQEVSRLRSPHAEARRIAIGPEDELYVAAGNYVSALDSHGVPRFEIAVPAPARCLAVTLEGEIYVGLRDHIEVFDRKAKRSATWDAPAPRTWFTGLTATAQGVFAADAGNRVVLRYDASGKLARRIGEKNKVRNIPGFIVPSSYFDLAMHRDGLLRVANPGRHRIEAYTVEGDFEFAWGKPSAAIDGFCGCCNPINIAMLADGRMVTCEKGLPRVKVYRGDGTFESVVAGPESFPENARVSSGDSLSDSTHGGLDAAVDSAGRIYILDLVTADIRVMARKADAPNSPVEKAPGGV
jgi:hypothetical protein